MVIDVTTIPVQPGLSTGSTTTVVLESVLQLSGLASSYNSYIRAAMIQDLADALGVQTTQITLTFVDGTPLVDHCFCTNDPAVYASGVITKFARRYKTRLAMDQCSGREAGAKLAQALLPVLDPISTAPVAETLPPCYSC